MESLNAAMKSSEMLLQDSARDAGVIRTRSKTLMKFQRVMSLRSVERKVKSAIAPPLSIMEMVLPKTSKK